MKGIALRMVLLGGVVIGALGAAAPAQATMNCYGGTATWTADTPGASVTVTQSGSQLAFAGLPADATCSNNVMTPTPPDPTALIIDFNANSGTATLDGTGTAISMQTILVKNMTPTSVLRIKGTVSGTTSVQINGKTTLVGSATLSSTGVITTGGTIDGAYPLTVNAGTWIVGGAIGVTTPLASLNVTAGNVSAAGSIVTTGVQTWHGLTEVDLADADLALRGSRVTIEGGVACASCAATRTLTFDVSEVAGGGNPGSSVRDLGGQTSDPDAWTFRLVKAGTGTLSLGGGAYRNAYTGGTQVDAGTLVVDVARALATGPVVVGENGTIAMNSNLTQPGAFQVDGALDIGAQYLTLYVGSLTGSGAIRCALSSCGDLTVMTTDTSGATAFTGSFGGDGTGTLGNFGLVKSGAGQLVLAGSSHHHGTTSVDAGTLRVTGTLGTGLSAGTVSVAAGARLTGWGDVGGDAFGNGLGISAAGTVDLTGLSQPETMSTAALGIDGGTLEMGVDSPASYSRLWVANFVMLTSNPVLRVHAGAGLTAGDVATIIRKTSGDAVTGTFAGLAEGAIVTPIAGTGTFRISYVGGDGNDVTLTYIAPPPAPAPAASSTGSNSAVPVSVGGSTTVRAATPNAGAGGVLSTSVTVPGPGTVTQTAVLAADGRARATVYCTARTVVKKAGAVTVRCAPTRAMRARLRGRGLTVVLTTSFAAKGGRPAVVATQTVAIARRP